MGNFGEGGDPSLLKVAADHVDKGKGVDRQDWGNGLTTRVATVKNEKKRKANSKRKRGRRVLGCKEADRGDQEEKDGAEDEEGLKMDLWRTEQRLEAGLNSISKITTLVNQCLKSLGHNRS